MLNRYRILFLLVCGNLNAQVKWTNVSSDYGIHSPSMHVYVSNDSLDGLPSKMFYVVIDIKDKKNVLEIDTTLERRKTPSWFYEKNNHPPIVVNCSFFEFVRNRNVNLIVRDGKTVAFDTPAVSRRGKDTLTYLHPLGSAFGISRKRDMDIVYQFNDSALDHAYYQQDPLVPFVDSSRKVLLENSHLKNLKKWKIHQAVGGGPVLLNQGQIRISNNEERKFAGKAIQDRHPRTAIGYTPDGKLVVLAVQGRMKGLAEGATLPQLAQIMKDIGCFEAMNLDGGGSSCLLVNGKETIKPSDPGGQRPVPAVLIIK